MAETDWQSLMDKPRIYADLNKGGSTGVILTTVGTWNDLERAGIELREGMHLDFWADDGDENGNPDPLLFSGHVHYSQAKGYWYALIRTDEIKHASELKEE